MQAKWVICLPGVGVFGQKPCGCAVVIAGIQVVQPTLAVILVSCIGDAVIGIPRHFQQCAECVVAVADFPVVLHPNQGDNIPMCIVEVIISFLPRPAAGKVDAVGIVCGDRPGGIRLKDNPVPLVEVAGNFLPGRALHPFPGAVVLCVVGVGGDGIPALVGGKLVETILY